MNNPKRLYQRFPYQFNGRNIGISVARGWFPAFAQLCHEIDQVLGADKHDFHWVQVKEKFGSARYYWEMGGKSELRVDMFGGAEVLSLSMIPTKEEDEDAHLRAKLRSLIAPVENATHTQCIACGLPGKPDRSTGWILVLCNEHARQRKLDELPDLWFSEDEQ